MTEFGPLHWVLTAGTVYLAGFIGVLVVSLEQPGLPVTFLRVLFRAIFWPAYLFVGMFRK